MIVRINQFDVSKADALAGWPADGLLGPIACAWPADSHAFELLILDKDEQAQALDASFRQMQIRRLIPELLAVLCDPDQAIVLRLDGPLADGGLLPALRYLVDDHRRGRFALSDALKPTIEAATPIVSLRLCHAPEHLARLCDDLAVGLDKDVRLRAFCLPEAQVPMLLELGAPDDPRWPAALPYCSMMLATERSLQGVQVISRRHTPDEAKAKLMQRLLTKGG